MRVVSLLPSATEIVYALGKGGDLVGRSEECDFPGPVRALPVVMRAKTLDSSQASLEIDDRVQRVRGTGESLYALDIELLKELRPDLIITQDLCGVCSVTEQEVHEACATAGLAPTIISLTPRTLDEVWQSIVAIGRGMEVETEATKLANSLRERSRPVVRPPRPLSVAVVEWLDPPILAGLWTPDLIEAAGGHPIAGESGSPGVRTTWNDLAKLAPDLVVVAPCSFSVDRSRAELEGTSLGAAVGHLEVPLGVWLADEAHFSRPGPRLADGVDLLRSLLAQRPPSGPWPALQYVGSAAA